METRTNLVLAVHVYERQCLWYVMDRPPGQRRRVIARGCLPHPVESPPADQFEALLLVALDAFRLHGR